MISIIALLLALLTVIVIPTLIGVYVYRDAKKHAMNAVLWTLIAVLAPAFIGLIIYLIVRSDTSDCACPQCGKNILESFSVCPYCGKVLTEKCSKCDFPLKAGWINCPQCGEPIPEEQRALALPSEKKDKGLRGILIAVIAVPLLLCILMVGALFVFSTAGVSSEGFIPEVSVSSVCERDPELKSWIEECDASGKGVYLLKSVTNEGKEKKTVYLLYRNDDSYWVTPMTQRGGLFKKPVVTFDCTKDEDSSAAYSLSYFEYTAPNECRAEVSQDGESISFIEKTADGIGLTDIDFAPEELNAEVSIADDVKTVYGIEFAIFEQYGETESQYCSNADNSAMHGANFGYPYFGKKPTELSITLYDADGNALFESERIKTGEQSNWSFEVKYNADGALEMVQQ